MEWLRPRNQAFFVVAFPFFVGSEVHEIMKRKVWINHCIVAFDCFEIFKSFTSLNWFMKWFIMEEFTGHCAAKSRSQIGINKILKYFRHKKRRTELSVN